MSVKYFVGKLTNNIQTTSVVLSNTSAGAATSPVGAPAGGLPKGPLNLLLLGLDTRAGWDQSGLDSRSDLESGTSIVLSLIVWDEAYVLEIVRPEAECAVPGGSAVVIMPRVLHHQAEILRAGKIDPQLDLGHTADIDRVQRVTSLCTVAQ